ncbi:tetratricopeptide repeat protein [Piscinibacter sp.]|uniref:tetratricopeptide repeat protein n=1 Tax=Piscinibacter sp. TaxID=1903157 RepID=UPI002D162E5C|nr:tetratricopeptide repeat protein [Albitalea sp.]HUG22190.1 tetratricopeptide repeat protein [Albitalea sp.]
MRTWTASLLCLVLSACAGTPTAPSPEGLFHDQGFAAPSERISAEKVFALSDEMQRYMKTDMAGLVRSKGVQRGLIDALYRRGDLKLEYDADLTKNAAQAFETRSGNCLSLVIMTAAFAKALGLDVIYQSAVIPETWSRSTDLYLASGHVNITLGHRLGARYGGSIGDDPFLIDFLPPEELSGLRTRRIGEETIVAMYMNNRAAEALAHGRVDDAYWWARAAIERDPSFVAAYNTLGVAYLRHRDPVRAETAFRRVLASEPRNTQAMFNLSRALAQLERDDESAAVQQRLAQIEPHPPFHFFNLGRAAMKRGEYRAARDWFAREVARSGDYHEFHHWLAIASFQLGDVEQANKHLSLAQESSATGSEKGLYAAKLAWLRSQRHH